MILNYCKAIIRIVDSFQPSAVVVQCGADGLNGDPVGECNLRLETYEICVRNILNCNLSTLLLGGGTYPTLKTLKPNIILYLLQVVTILLTLPNCGPI